MIIFYVAASLLLLEGSKALHATAPTFATVVWLVGLMALGLALIELGKKVLTFAAKR